MLHFMDLESIYSWLKYADLEFGVLQTLLSIDQVYITALILRRMIDLKN